MPLDTLQGKMVVLCFLDRTRHDIFKINLEKFSDWSGFF